MANTLFLFLFSYNPDSYVNVITYTYDKMDIDKIKLVYIKGIATGLKAAQASNLSTKIWSRVAELQDKHPIYKNVNERLLDRQLVPIEYRNIKNDLNQVLKGQISFKNCIIDITGATKVPSIDIFSICLALGANSIYTFELFKKQNEDDPTYNLDNLLYHSLSEKDYSYTCVSNTEPVKSSQASLLRKSLLLWYLGGFSLFLMMVSLYLLSVSKENVFIQILNLAAAVSSLFSTIIVLVEQKHKN